MFPSIRAVQIILFLAWLTGLYSTWYLMIGNGTVESVKRLQLSDPPSLPNGGPLKISYTGFKSLDNHLSAIAIIFWPVLDGSMPNLSLDTLNFVGQTVALWSLCLLEGMRVGNKGKLVSYILLWGLLLQNTVYALTMPIFLGLYLATSPLICPSPWTLLSDPAEAISIPFSVFLGMIVPSILCSFSAPSVISYDSKQSIMAVAHMFPVLTSAFQQVFKRIIRMLMPSKRPSEQCHLWALRVVYTFALLVASITRIFVFTLSITSVLFPMLFSPAHVESLAPSMIFWPASTSSAQQTLTIGSGVLLMLQYDELVGSASVLLWAALLFARAWNQFKTSDRLIPVLVAACLSFLLAGPIGCAVVLIWARDELVIERGDHTSNQATQAPLKI